MHIFHIQICNLRAILAFTGHDTKGGVLVSMRVRAAFD